jgi:hypothetical protein
MPVNVTEIRHFNPTLLGERPEPQLAVATGRAPSATVRVGAKAGTGTIVATGEAFDATVSTDAGSAGIYYGGWDNVRAQQGLDDALADSIAHAQPLMMFSRGYSGASHPSTFASSSVSNAASWNNGAMLNTKFPNIDALVSGTYDNQIRGFYNSWPVGVRGWVCINHEFGNDGRSAEAAVYRASTAHYIHVAAEVIRDRGLDVGVGGCGMQFDWEPQTGPRWPLYAWWQEVDPIDLPQTVFGLDIYAKHLTNPLRGEDIINDPEGLLAIFDEARTWGITRFAIFETALDKRRRNFQTQIIGTDASIADWIPWYASELEVVQGLEAVCYFHSDVGPASQYAQLNGVALPAYATVVANGARS